MPRRKPYTPRPRPPKTSRAKLEKLAKGLTSPQTKALAWMMRGPRWGERHDLPNPLVLRTMERKKLFFREDNAGPYRLGHPTDLAYELSEYIRGGNQWPWDPTPPHQQRNSARSRRQCRRFMDLDIPESDL